MLDYVQIVVTSMIVGGMLSFQILFAPLVFIKLKSEQARPFIRSFFPYYYLYFAFLSLLLVVIDGSFVFVDSLADQVANTITAVLLFLTSIIVFIGFVISRQILMPRANKATDEGRSEDFTRYHRLTVLVNTVQLIIMLTYLWFIK